MDVAVAVVWWVGLAGALLLALVLLKFVAVILRVLGHIHRLALLTRAASLGVRANLVAAGRMADLDQPARQLHASLGEMAAAVDALAIKTGVAAGEQARR